jgi:hypothetical protein
MSTVLPTYSLGRIRYVTEIVSGYAILLRAGPVNDPFYILNVYLRPGEQTNILSRISRKLQELLPTGRLYIGGDFNMDPADERLQRFLKSIASVHAFGHNGAPKKYPHTFKSRTRTVP